MLIREHSHNTGKLPVPSSATFSQTRDQALARQHSSTTTSPSYPALQASPAFLQPWHHPHLGQAGQHLGRDGLG